MRLYLHKSYGGLGLVHIVSRLHAFRLRFIHEYLYYDRHSCFGVENVFLEVNNFGYSKQLFLTMPVIYDVSNISPLYQSLMNTWPLFSHHKLTPLSPVDGIPVEQQFISLCITKVKHLCEVKSYEPQFKSFLNL